MKTLTPYETRAVVGGRSLGFVKPGEVLGEALGLLGDASHFTGSEGTPHLTGRRHRVHPSTSPAGQD